MYKRKGPKPLPESERFWNKVEKSGLNDCWLWAARRLPKGYGQFEQTCPKATAYAHRVAWRLVFGTVPDGLFVCHKCDNPPCVNPNHLFLGTAKDNTADMDAKGRRVNTPAPKGTILFNKITPTQVKEIRELYAAIPKIGRYKKKGEVANLVAQYPISISQLHNIVTGVCWKDV